MRERGREASTWCERPPPQRTATRREIETLSARSQPQSKLAAPRRPSCPTRFQEKRSGKFLSLITKEVISFIISITSLLISFASLKHNVHRKNRDWTGNREVLLYALPCGYNARI